MAAALAPRSSGEFRTEAMCLPHTRAHHGACALRICWPTQLCKEDLGTEELKGERGMESAVPLQGRVKRGNYLLGVQGVNSAACHLYPCHLTSQESTTKQSHPSTNVSRGHTPSWASGGGH